MIPPDSQRATVTLGKPRASGDDPAELDKTRAEIEVNPARAGMIPRKRKRETNEHSKPRASGDDPGRQGRPMLGGQ